MKTFVYKNKNLRCKVVASENNPSLLLQLQKKGIFPVWTNVFYNVTISEGFWGEKVCGSFINGSTWERYKTGTLDLQLRIEDLFNEYQDDLISKQAIKNRLNELLQNLN